MYIETLVSDVRKVVESLRGARGDFVLAMLYNSGEGVTTRGDLIVAAPWTDKLGVVEATRAVTRELSSQLSSENRTAISRAAVLRTDDPFVQEITRLFSVSDPRHGLPIANIAPDGIPIGTGYIFYSQRNAPVQIAS